MPLEQWYNVTVITAGYGDVVVMHNVEERIVFFTCQMQPDENPHEWKCARDVPPNRPVFCIRFDDADSLETLITKLQAILDGMYESEDNDANGSYSGD